MKQFLIKASIWLLKAIGFITLVLLILWGFIELLLLFFHHPIIGFVVLILGAFLFLSVMVALSVTGWLKKSHDLLKKKNG